MKKMQILLVIMLCLAVCWLVLREIKVRNVFDEMYYGHYELNKLNWTQTSYLGVLNLRDYRLIPEYKVPGYISQVFPSTLIDEDTLVDLEWHYNQGLFSIRVIFIQKTDDNSKYPDYKPMLETMRLFYIYNTKEKKLIYQPISLYSNSYKEEGKDWPDDPAIISQFMQEFEITRDDIDNINNNIIFEILLPMWFDANGGRSKYSMENLGELEIINNQFPGVDD